MKERKNTKYLGKKTFVDKDTGEVVEFDHILRTESSQNFIKMYLMEMTVTLDIVGNQKTRLLSYLFDNMSFSNNSLIKTQREIAKESGISLRTVSETMKLLQEKNIIRKKAGAYMLNPNLLVKGNEDKRKRLLIEFDSFDNNVNN